MRPRKLLILLAGLAACGGSSALPPPVMTLYPAAFDGGSMREDKRCLDPGDSAVSTVYVHERSVRFTVRGVAGDGAELGASLGGGELPIQKLSAEEPFELTYRAHPPNGRQELRLFAPRDATRPVCFDQVAVAQP